MRVLRVLLRVLGWLLTPLVAWAASFLGASVGALVAPVFSRPVPGVILTFVAGGAAGFTALVFWIRLIRHSRGLQQALHVAEDGTPDTEEITEEIVEILTGEEAPEEPAERAEATPAP